MKTLHNNDSGYIEFYKDVLNEMKTFRSISNYKIPNKITNEHIIDQYEFWIEEAFYEPEYSDDVLAMDTATKVLSIYESNSK